jgi:hypothetical protein
VPSDRCSIEEQSVEYLWMVADCVDGSRVINIKIITRQTDSIYQYQDAKGRFSIVVLIIF